MGVYANGNEISGKATANKSIAAMPDVCMSPPAPPAGPVPIPYPNTAMASDTDKGSKSVKIKNKPTGLKNASTYKKSNGNQPATNNFGAGVVSHKLTGACKFAAWSFDVKIEGKNAVRFMDLTTHNHTNTTNGAGTSSIAGKDGKNAGKATCKDLRNSNEQARASMQENGRPKYVNNAGGGNATITHAKFKPKKGAASILRACSRQAISFYDNSFVLGLTREERRQRRLAKRGKNKSKVKSGACGGHVYKSGFSRPHTSHTEARIIEHLFKNKPSPRGGTLTLAIDWPGGPDAGATSASPCKNCKDLLCAAASCMKIVLCSTAGKPKKLRCKKSKK